MSDISEPFIGELEAFRAFTVEGTDLLSIGLGAHLWQPGVNRARCHLAGKRLGSRTVWVNDPDDPSGLSRREEEQLHAHGRIPSLSCTCGFWVFKDETGCRAEFGGHDLVIGRVLIWGRAIEHDTGYRAEFARITALIIEHPLRFASVAAAYGIGIVHPRTKAEEGITTAYLTMVDGDWVKLDVPVRDSDEVIGFFTVAPGIDVPDPVAHVTARFSPDRVITEFRVHADDQDDEEH